jgi:hypothetical protein
MSQTCTAAGQGDRGGAIGLPRPSRDAPSSPEAATGRSGSRDADAVLRRWSCT